MKLIFMTKLIECVCKISYTDYKAAAYSFCGVSSSAGKVCSFEHDLNYNQPAGHHLTEIITDGSAGSTPPVNEETRSAVEVKENILSNDDPHTCRLF